LIDVYEKDRTFCDVLFDEEGPVGLATLEDGEEAMEARLAFLRHARNRKTSVTTALEYACADGRVLENSSTGYA
jgi:hypothetical protein